MLTDNEIIDMVGLKRSENRFDLAVGPRATTDTSASVNTKKCSMGYRLRGQEQIVRAIEDIKRAIVLDVHLSLYDEGCLWLLNEMRKEGYIPSKCHFKVSAHTGHVTCSAKLLEKIGANSINQLRYSATNVIFNASSN